MSLRHARANFSHSWRCALIGAGVSLVAAAPASAEIFPNIHGALAMEIEDDLVVDADDKAAEINDLFATIELGAALHLTPQFSLNMSLVFEPIEDATDDREFEDQGLYAEELYLRHDFGPLAVVAGKFNPTFGTAWDLAPGIYGADFAEDYELTERIGGAVSVPFDAADASHEFTLSTFFAATNAISGSTINHREELSQNDGGPSNTGDFSSFSATLDGGLPETDVAYHLGARYQSGGDGDPDDEFGLVGGLSGAIKLSDDAAIEAIAELAYFENQDAGDADAYYGTVGAAYSWTAWTASLAYTLREIDGGGNDTDHLIATSLAYAFDFGLGVEVGYKFAEEAGEDSHTVGAVVSYEIEF